MRVSQTSSGVYPLFGAVMVPLLFGAFVIGVSGRLGGANPAGIRGRGRGGNFPGDGVAANNNNNNNREQEAAANARRRRQQQEEAQRRQRVFRQQQRQRRGGMPWALLGLMALAVHLIFQVNVVLVVQLSLLVWWYWWWRSSVNQLPHGSVFRLPLSDILNNRSPLLWEALITPLLPNHI
jgi:phage-related minor tail protein